MPLSVESDLGLHCLPVSHKKDARLIWVKMFCNEEKGHFPTSTQILVSLF